MKLFLLLLFLACSVACTNTATSQSNQSNATPSPTAAPFSKEDDIVDDAELRQQARQKAIEYANQNFAGWRVKGIISRKTFDEHYQVTLDLEKGTETKTVQLLLRLFFPETGEPYWKVEPFISQNVSRKYEELAYLRFVKGEKFTSDECVDVVAENSYDDRDYEPPDPY